MFDYNGLVNVVCILAVILMALFTAFGALLSYFICGGLN